VLAGAGLLALTLGARAIAVSRRPPR